MMEISFLHRELAFKRYSADGEGINPALSIKNIPEKTRSLVLILDDPDAPGQIFIHWILFDIDVRETIEENSIPGKEGKNSINSTEYCPPAPPKGKPHHYIFHLYALDKMVGLKEGVSRKELENAMKGHILDTAEVAGIYERK